MRAPEFWDDDGGPLARLAAGFLMPLGRMWDLGGRLRRWAARPYRAPVPVLCVGNLVAGGAGKTPVVLSLAAMLAGRRDVHVVMRGYGGRLRGPLRVDPRCHDAAAVGDEPLLVAARAPCWIARDRAAGVRQAVAAGAEIVILDDGFQSAAVAIDRALLVVDAEYGFGNRRVIPAGPLREAAPAGLARGDAVVLLGDGVMPPELAAAGLPILRAALQPVDGARFAGLPVVAFAGIGRPAKFFTSLRHLGARLVAAVPFPDHHNFSATEIAGLRRQATSAGARLVTTAKDGVRLPPPLRQGIEVLEAEIVWHDGAAMAHLLADALRQEPSPSLGDSRRRAAAS